MAAYMKMDYRGHTVSLWAKSYRIDDRLVVYCGDRDPTVCAVEAIDRERKLSVRFALWLDDLNDRIAMMKPPVPGWAYQWGFAFMATYAFFAEWGNVTVGSVLFAASSIIHVQRMIERERRDEDE